MIAQRWILIAFFAMILLQLALPLRTVYQHEWTVRNGEAFKFETRPTDPNDPFRGKYVVLDFEPLEADLSAAQINVLGTEVYTGQPLYLTIEKDDRGFARAVDLSAELPAAGAHYVPVKASYPRYKKGVLTAVDLDYPFSRFYLEETKAPRAEERFREATRQDSVETYALVHLHNGIVVLTDVLIDGKSLVED